MTPDQLAKSKSEHAEQRALFAWCNMAQRYGSLVANDNSSYKIAGYAQRLWEANMPSMTQPILQLKWLHAIHNQGHGDAIRGARAKAEGVKAGVADLFLPVPVYYGGELIQDKFDHWHNGKQDCYHGLYIEMKREDKGTLSKEQSDFASDMLSVGYKWVVCFGWKSARNEILKYLGLS